MGILIQEPGTRGNRNSSKRGALGASRIFLKATMEETWGNWTFFVKRKLQGAIKGTSGRA